MRRKVPTERLQGLLESENGLTTAEAASRAQAFGSNDIVEAPPGTWRDLARDTLRDIKKDPSRTMVVIDPRKTETAKLAHTHLQPRPGTDAFLIAAILGIECVRVC